jgi:hypothetical protein
MVQKSLRPESDGRSMRASAAAFADIKMDTFALCLYNICT